MFNKLKRKPYLLLGILIFILMYIFFTNIRPLIVFDADDWTYLAASRQFIPILNAWNPARVFPEVLMPLCGSIAAYVVYPLTNNYIGSFSIVFSVVISFFIALYFYSFAKMLAKVFDFRAKISLALTSLFFLFHFLLLATTNINNQYMFLAHDVTCYFYYLIPNLLNFTIVFTFMAKDKNTYQLSTSNPFKLGVFLLILYIAIFSNLYCSIILAVYAGSLLLVNFFKEINKKFNLVQFLKKNLLFIGIILAWFVSALFELTGGRADMAPHSNFLEALIETFGKFIKSLTSVNKMVFLFLLVTTISFLLVLIIDLINQKKKSKINQVLLLVFIATIVIALYFVLLSAKVNPNYVSSVVYIYGFWAYLLIFEFLGIGYLLKRNNILEIVLPFLIVLFLVKLNCSINTLKESNVNNYNSETCEAISNDIVSQIKSADDLGLTKVYLHVPYYENKDNWPQAIYLSNRISYTLYKHKITKREMTIEVVRDLAYNEKFQIEG